MNIFSCTIFDGNVTIGLEAPQYWWDDFTQCTEIVPKLYPLLLSINTEDMFSEYEDEGIFRMMKDAILQASTEYSINPNPITEKRICEILPMCINRKGYIHAKLSQVQEWIADKEIYIRAGKTTVDWEKFLGQLRGYVRG